MIRMIQFVATVALALTLAACDGNDSNNSGEIERLEAALKEAREMAMDLESELAAAQVAQPALEAALKEAQARVTTLEAELNELRSELVAMEAEQMAQEDARARVKILEEELEELKIELARERERLVILEAALEEALAGSEQLGIYDVGARFAYDTDYGEQLVAEVLGETTHRGRRVVIMSTNIQLSEDNTCHGGDTDYRDWQTGSWVACLKDGEVLGEIIPHWGERRFPLLTGDTWELEVEWVDHVNGPDYGSSWTAVWGVTACDIEITVPAGTFSTCTVSDGGGNETYWYAMEDGLFVRYSGSGVDLELSDYDLTPLPSERGAM